MIHPNGGGVKLWKSSSRFAGHIPAGAQWRLRRCIKKASYRSPERARLRERSLSALEDASARQEVSQRPTLTLSHEWERGSVR